MGVFVGQSFDSLQVPAYWKRCGLCPACMYAYDSIRYDWDVPSSDDQVLQDNPCLFEAIPIECCGEEVRGLDELDAKMRAAETVISSLKQLQ